MTRTAMHGVITSHDCADQLVHDEVLLARSSSQDDIVIGTPFANRNVPGVEGLLGCFVNTLAIRLGTAPSSTFTSTAARQGCHDGSLCTWSHTFCPGRGPPWRRAQCSVHTSVSGELHAVLSPLP